MTMQQVFAAIPTEEMRAHFQARTDRHIARVQHYCARLAALPGLAALADRAAVHDASKFLEPEHTPYVWLTWRYRCQDAGVPCPLPPGMEARMVAATEHHILTNAHHPEYHQGRTAHLLNPGDRDAPPAEAVDATGMGDLDLAEMVADWCSVSEERGNTPRAWADRNVGVRWLFTPAQVGRIGALISAAWGA